MPQGRKIVFVSDDENEEPVVPDTTSSHATSGEVIHLREATHDCNPLDFAARSSHREVHVADARRSDVGNIVRVRNHCVVVARAQRNHLQVKTVGGYLPEGHQKRVLKIGGIEHLHTLLWLDGVVLQMRDVLTEVEREDGRWGGLLHKGGLRVNQKPVVLALRSLQRQENSLGIVHRHQLLPSASPKASSSISRQVNVVVSDLRDVWWKLPCDPTAKHVEVLVNVLERDILNRRQVVDQRDRHGRSLLHQRRLGVDDHFNHGA
mmetsp:Transcript_107638/g.343548  ORF Transcript_107638/g.343548 Transcript_107638/m.343548 type:complete len:263 (+) Transcript_107638:1133-1921(+)